MIKTQKVTQPTIYAPDAVVAAMRKSLEKPRASFKWDGVAQMLHVTVPAEFPPEYITAFQHAQGLHLIMSRDAWFTPVPEQPYCLCIIDERSEALLLGFTPYDWQDAVAPVIDRTKQKAEATITTPDGQQRTVTLLVGGAKKR